MVSSKPQLTFPLSLGLDISPSTKINGVNNSFRTVANQLQFLLLALESAILKTFSEKQFDSVVEVFAHPVWGPVKIKGGSLASETEKLKR